MLSHGALLGFVDLKVLEKGTPFAAKTAATTAAKQSIAQGMRQAKVMVKGQVQDEKLQYADYKRLDCE